MAADHWIEQNFSFIAPSDEDEVTLQWDIEKAEAASVVQHNAKLSSWIRGTKWTIQARSRSCR
jgi:hypothetical protein